MNPEALSDPTPSQGADGGLRPRGTRQWLALVGFAATCLAVGATGGLVTAPAVQGWYATLEKPPLNPPAWVFGPTWTLLYLMMGCAAFLAWRHRGLRSRPLALFGLQLLLNAAWSPVFFGLAELGAAACIIAVLWVAIFATLIDFWRTQRAAGVLLLPYLAWVSFASYLNFALWRLNPDIG